MSIERGGDSPLSPDEKARIDSVMHEVKLDMDAINIFGGYYNGLFALRITNDASTFTPLQHYEEYLRARSGSSDAKVAYTISLSDKEAVAALDHVIDEYNTALEDIKARQDWDKLEEYYDKLTKLLREENVH